MKELERLRVGLMNSTMLFINDRAEKFTCFFVKEGMVKQRLVIEDDVLATALKQAGVAGILEGPDFQVFKDKFDRFSLHVKAKKLYQELTQAA